MLKSDELEFEIELDPKYLNPKQVAISILVTFKNQQPQIKSGLLILNGKEASLVYGEDDYKLTIEILPRFNEAK